MRFGWGLKQYFMRFGVDFELFPVKGAKGGCLVVYIFRQSRSADQSFHIAAKSQDVGQDNLDRHGTFLGTVGPGQAWGCFKCDLSEPLLIEIVPDDALDVTSVDTFDQASRLEQVIYRPNLIVSPEDQVPVGTDVRLYHFDGKEELGTAVFSELADGRPGDSNRRHPFSKTVREIWAREYDKRPPDQMGCLCWFAHTDTEVGPVQSFDYESPIPVTLSLSSRHEQVPGTTQLKGRRHQDPNWVKRIEISLDCSCTFRSHAEIAANVLAFIWPEGASDPFLIPMAEAKSTSDGAHGLAGLKLALRKAPLAKRPRANARTSAPGPRSAKEKTNELEQLLTNYVLHHDEEAWYDAPLFMDGPEVFSSDGKSLKFTAVWAGPFDVVGIWAYGNVKVSVTSVAENTTTREKKDYGAFTAFRLGVDGRPMRVDKKRTKEIADNLADIHAFLGLGRYHEIAQSPPTDLRIGPRLLELQNELGARAAPLLRYLAQREDKLESLKRERQSEATQLLKYLKSLGVLPNHPRDWYDSPQLPQFLIDFKTFREKLMRGAQGTQGTDWKDFEGAAKIVAVATSGFALDANTREFIEGLTWPRQLCFVEFVLSGVDPAWFVENNVIPNVRYSEGNLEKYVLDHYAARTWSSKLLELAFATQRGWIDEREFVGTVPVARLGLNHTSDATPAVSFSVLKNEARLFAILQRRVSTEAESVQEILENNNVPIDLHTDAVTDLEPLIFTVSPSPDSSEPAAESTTPESGLTATEHPQPKYVEVLRNYEKARAEEFDEAKTVILNQCETVLKLDRNVVNSLFDVIRTRACLHLLRQAFYELELRQRGFGGLYHVGKLILEGNWENLVDLDTKKARETALEIQEMKWVANDIQELARRLSTEGLAMDRIRAMTIAPDQDATVAGLVTGIRSQLEDLSETSGLQRLRTPRGDASHGSAPLSEFDRYYQSLHALAESLAVRQVWLSRHEALKEVLDGLTAREGNASSELLKRDATLLHHRRSAPLFEWPDLLERIDEVIRRARPSE